MVIHSPGVCCGTSYFAPHVLRPSIEFTMDFNVGAKVFYTHSNGVRVSATVVGLSPEGLIHLKYFQDAIKVVNRQCKKKMDTNFFAIPSADSPPHCSPSPPLEECGRIWAEEVAPKVDEDDDDTYLFQVCGKRDISECSTCDFYLCSECMHEHTCEIEVLE